MSETETKAKVYEGIVNFNFTVGTRKNKRKVYVKGKPFKTTDKGSFESLIKSRRIRRIPVAKKTK